MKQGRAGSHRRIFIPIALVALALGLSLAFIPPVRAFANQFLQEIILGKYSSVAQVNPEQTRTAESITATLPANAWTIQTPLGLDGGPLPVGADPTLRHFDTISAAQAELGYPLRMPGYLPAGYSLKEVILAPKAAEERAYQIFSGPGEDIVLVSIPVGAMPCPTPLPGTSTPEGLVVACQAVDQMVTTGSLKEASVNDQPAAWVNGDRLVWEYGNITYEVGGPGLSMEDAVKIAGSIR